MPTFEDQTTYRTRLFDRLANVSRLKIWGLSGLAFLLIATLNPPPAHAYGVFQTLHHQVTGFEALTEVAATSISPDDRYLYVGGFESVVVLERDQGTGTLSPIQNFFAFPDGYGAFSISRLIMSPDGQNLYATSITPSALITFQRDPATGLLAFVERLTEPFEDPDFFRSVTDVSISSDGRHVYTLTTAEPEIAVFQRDPTTGSLHIISQVQGVEDVPQLQEPLASALSPDGNQLYVADRLGGLLTFTRDPESGALTFKCSLNGAPLIIEQPNDLVIDPGGETLYIAGRSDDFSRAIIGFARDEEGNLSQIDGVFGLDLSNEMLIDATGSNLYMTSVNQVVVFSRDSDGHLALRQTLRDGIDGVDGLDGSSLATLDTQGNYLYVASKSDAAVATFARTASSGDLTFVDAVFDGDGATLDGLANTVGIYASSDEEHVYMVGQENSVLAQYRRSADGSLAFGQAISLRELGLQSFANIKGMIVSPDERNIIVLDDLDGVWIFSRDAVTGGVDFLHFEDLFSASTQEVVFSPDSRFLFTSSLSDLAIFDFDSASGVLTQRLSFTWPHPVFLELAVAPEGRLLYAGGRASELGGDAQISLFEWDEDTNMVTFRGETGSLALGSQVGALTMSPDGRFLLAAGAFASDASEAGLAVFERQTESGELTEIQTLIDGVDGVTGLKNPTLNALSQSGTRLMATSVATISVSNFFARNPETGLLTLLEQRMRADGSGPPQINTYQNLAWSPAGDQFYLSWDDTLYAFDEGFTVCEPGPTILCLGDNGRFKVEVSWTDFVGGTGVGHKVTESADSGLFWFFDPDNWEMLVKVIDGCDFNGHYWVFAAATTNVGYSLTVTDTHNGTHAVYRNALGVSSPAITDDQALATCP